MKTKIEQLRADLMTKGAFAWYERRKLRYLTKANEAQRNYVKAALPVKHWARSCMDTCGQVDEWGNIKYCSVPLCPRCFMRERGHQTGKAIKEIFCDAANEDLAFATILLPPQLDFSGMTALVENEKRRLRTFIDRRRKTDTRWNDFQLLGWWEIDRMNFGDYEACGRNTRIALDAMGFPLMEAPDKTIWRPHLHAIVRKGRLSREEIASALRKETHTAKYQVDVEPFRSCRDVKMNLRIVIRYCLKFRIETDYKAPDAQDFIANDQTVTAKPANRKWWPAEDVRAYVDWLCLQRSGFRSLRVFIGQAQGVANEQNPSLSASMNKKLESGGLSMSSMSNRFQADAAIKPMKAHVMYMGVERDLVVEDNVYFLGNGSGSVVVDYGLTHSAYNNYLHDTNWTSVSADDVEDNPAALTGIKASSRYPGNVVSLSERLRSIASKMRRSDGERGSAAT